jgi:hypothetical protein
LPFGRSAVLEVDGSSHNVTLEDLSRGGALIATTVAVTGGQTLVLKAFLPLGAPQSTLPCELVRVIRPRDPSDGRQPRLAVRFTDLDQKTLQQLEAFVTAGSRNQLLDEAFANREARAGKWRPS